MNFAPPRRKPLNDNLLPMINVVFLLLIFFLLVARMTPPAPFAVTLPGAKSEQLAGAKDMVLSLSDQGLPGFRGESGEKAMAALAAACPKGGCGEILVLRADQAAPAQTVARLMPKLVAMGFRRVDLVVSPIKAGPP